MEDVLLVCDLNSVMLKLINKLDKDSREASIFSIICTLKMQHPEEFEAALITFLRDGKEAIDICKRRLDNAEN